MSAFLDLNALECDGVMVQWDAGWRRITFAGYHRDMQLTFTERRHGREKKRASNHTQITRLIIVLFSQGACLQPVTSGNAITIFVVRWCVVRWCGGVPTALKSGRHPLRNRAPGPSVLSA